ncbi:response regulator [Pseudomonas sp. rhizo25]|uniref:response regulator n=1 Tax=Pseudomonas sp. rhizo25 TaxID=3059675 RepID=UPI0028909A61|nr:response regulator [Pseudomonas sp. rhizo25]MDT3228607.1 response regulator [Pseudomonas sp. rhizo25]
MRHAATPAHWRQQCVLVVEDHCVFRAMTGWQLDKLGLSHHLVENGSSAMAAIACRRFDLVISDCQMPVMDGYSLARAIRQREQDLGCERVPIIALTGNLVHDDPQRCRDAGMDAWLLKPLALEPLRDMLMRWLPGERVALPSRSPGVSAPGWPTRASLVELFGSPQVVDQMLRSLLTEALLDTQALTLARNALDARLTAERLHRLVGSLAFLGGAGLESRGSALISEVRTHGVAFNQQKLEVFQRDLAAYLDYLREL